MERIPLQGRLKGKVHRKIAYAQDFIVKKVYSILNNTVLHGGTAIWRCFNGKRLSEDLDFYFSKDLKKIERVFENLEKLGFEIKKKKILKSRVYSELILDRTLVRIEASFQKISGVLVDYEMSDENFSSRYGLAFEWFLSEKANVYLKRFKIKNSLDVFFLLKNVKEIKKIKEIGILIKKYKKQIDEEDLKVILLEGIVLSSEDMIQYIRKKWENKYI